jgi:hypothetical protein
VAKNEGGLGGDPWGTTYRVSSASISKSAAGSGSPRQTITCHTLYATMAADSAPLGEKSIELPLLRVSPFRDEPAEPDGLTRPTG